MPEALQRLGAPPTSLGQRVEPLFCFAETEAGSGDFEPAPWLGESGRIRIGCNDEIPTAEIAVNLARDTQAFPEYSAHPLDYQVLLSDGAVALAWERLLTGRRVQVRTARESPQEDWVLFEGFITKVAPGWSGNNRGKARWLTVYAQSSALAADRELGQQVFGQWRRSRDAQLKLANQESGAFDDSEYECVRVTSLPAIFNPGGRPNCDPDPLDWGEVANDGTLSRVYVFTDEDNPAAIPWTIARMLRYLQWAALQPEPPTPRGGAGDSPTDPRIVNTQYFSDERAVETIEEQTGWTSLRMGFGNLSRLLRLTMSLAPDSTPGGSARDRALVRRMDDIAVEGMSVLEGLAFVCEKAGMFMVVESAIPEGGGTWVQTGVRLSIRNDRSDDAETGSPEDFTSRALYLYVPSDRITTPSAAADIFARVNATEGSVLIDESAMRLGVWVGGAPTQYEGAFPLRPGWEAAPRDSAGNPQPSWWDNIDESNATELAQALARVGTPEWQQRFHRKKWDFAAQQQWGRVGRFWVLGEDDEFYDTRYVRTHGPWRTIASWRPFNFYDSDNTYLGVRVADLNPRAETPGDPGGRGAHGWSTRRRRFLPLLAKPGVNAGDGVELDVHVQVSYTGDSGPWYFLTSAKIKVMETRAAIYIDIDDLTDGAVADPTTGMTLPAAYIRGDLRVRAIATIEGDDALRGYVTPSGRALGQLSWWEYVDRRDQYLRKLREAVTSNPISTLALDIPEPGARDDSDEARKLAVRLRDELELRRHSGQVTIPWLVRDGEAAWPGYKIGDEILGVQTQSASTHLPMRGRIGGINDLPAARVCAIEYAWGPNEQSTTLTIEDRTFGADDEPGPPDAGQALTAVGASRLARAIGGAS